MPEHFDILDHEPEEDRFRVRIKKGRKLFQKLGHSLGLEFALNGKRFYYVENSSPDSAFWFQNRAAIKEELEPEPEAARRYLEAGAAPFDREGIGALDGWLNLFENEVFFLKKAGFRCRLARNPHGGGSLLSRLLEPVGLGGAGPADQAPHYLHGETWQRAKETAFTPYLLPTRNLKRLDQGVVKRYREAIAAGRTPAGFGYTILIKKRALPPEINPLLIVTILLDGHHRAMAWAQLNRPFPVVCLVDTDWSGNYLDEIFSLFPLTRGQD